MLLKSGTENSVVEKKQEFLSIVNSKNSTFKTFSFPITTTDDCKKLDDALSNLSFRKELMEQIFKNVGKNDGEVEGHFLNKISNQIFQDTLLSMYTYKGISRNGIQKKC